MEFQILKIVLWPRNADRVVREVTFKKDSLNIITGDSRTGKSAIIPIIDYCLGSERCSIPTGVIREHVAWFGIVIASAGGELLFARREPATKQSTEDMFVLEALRIVIPKEIQKNATAKAVKQRLDHLSGLTTLGFGYEGAAPDNTRPSFRDLTAFTFQPQNIVANPNALFYKSDTIEHRAKLRTILPYVLGAVTAETLAKRYQVDSLSRRLRQKEIELNNIRAISVRWKATIGSRYDEARDLGLANAYVTNPRDDVEIINRLRAISTIIRPAGAVTAETIDDSIRELQQLDAEESVVADQLSIARRRMAEMQRLKTTSSDYRKTLILQSDRLHLSRWLSQQEQEEKNCPVCDNILSAPDETLLQLIATLKNLEESADRLSKTPPAFDRELERARASIYSLTDQLKGVHIRQAGLMKTSDEARARQYSNHQASRFLGRLESELETFESVGTDGDLSAEVEELREQVNDLMKQLSGAQVEANTRRALNKVDLAAGRIIPNLDAERPNAPIKLDERELTVKIEDTDREDFLWELGSGSNWLSYHIAVSLGLHQVFLDTPNCTVPNFIVYDQPSQVYFPKRLAMRSDETDESVYTSDQLRSKDVDALKRIFGEMAQITSAPKSRLQIIVLDHAADDIWGGIPGIHFVEEWRDGRALIPSDWLSSAKK